MMNSGVVNENQIIICTDLDYSIYITDKMGIHCIGGEYRWPNLFKKAHDYAYSQGVNIVFTIVTHKPFFDDLCADAVNKFQPWLEKYQPKLLKDEMDNKWCLVNLNGVTQYVSYSPHTPSIYLGWIPENVFSPVHITQQEKSRSIMKIASHFNVALENCIILDDTSDVLEDAQSYGIETVSLTAFHVNKNAKNYQEKINLLDNDEYINDCFVNIEYDFMHKVKNAVERVKNNAVEVKKIPEEEVTCKKESLLNFFNDLECAVEDPAFNLSSFIAEKSTYIESLCPEELLATVNVGFHEGKSLFWFSTYAAACGYTQLLDIVWDKVKDEVSIEHCRVKSAHGVGENHNALWYMAYATQYDPILMNTLLMQMKKVITHFDLDDFSKDRTGKNYSVAWLLFYTACTQNITTWDSKFISLFQRYPDLLSKTSKNKYSFLQLIEKIQDHKRKEKFIECVGLIKENLPLTPLFNIKNYKEDVDKDTQRTRSLKHSV